MNLLGGLLLPGALGAAGAALEAGAGWTWDAQAHPELGVERSRVLRWTDSQGLARRLWVAEAAPGRQPGFLCQLAYDSPEVLVRGGTEHLGGVTEVMHLGKSKDGAKAVAGLRDGLGAEQSMLLEGPWHLRHRLRYRFEAQPKPELAADKIRVTRDLVCFPGRDELLYSVSFDFSAQPAGQAVYDSRSPYQEWDWALNGYKDYTGFECGGRGLLRVDAVDGGRGEATRSDFSNAVPFNRAWDSRSDRETGMVATRLWQEQPQGQEAWAGSDEPILAPGRRGLDQIPAWELPYQVGAYYQWTPKSTWQTYQRLGVAAVHALGRDWNAYPRYSYSVWLCLGRASRGRVREIVSEVERQRRCRLTARLGSVPAAGPQGIDDGSLQVYPVPGLDPVLGVWRAQAAPDGRLDLDLALDGRFQAPALIVRGLSRQGRAYLNGQPDGLWVSRDARTGETWISVPGVRGGILRLEWR